MDSSYSRSNKSFIDRLIENCEKAKAASPVNEFVLQNLSQLDGMKQAIYVIEQVDGSEEAVFEVFSRYKNKNERKCAKLNSPSKIMYVGSSTTGVRKRIEQHKGEGHAGTYALHLKHWFRSNYKITIKQYSECKEVLQIIEDDLSDRLKPAFGKQGGNNK
ncbi:MAG: GIY-YIG nuclease family protein [Aliiglaciecola sp.]|uniref:GIY-YIG nuclease family protein n=1 Tax=Aliiglaciecola sp. TaxID=1872441 RepID=UPI0032976BD1